jgi:hypothetical protein
MDGGDGHIAPGSAPCHRGVIFQVTEGKSHVVYG